MTASDALKHLAEKITELEVGELAAVALELGGVLVALAARMAMSPAGKAEPPDHLVDADEARRLLGNISLDHLYQSPDLRPIRVRVGRRVLFSHAAIQKMIERRAGR
jgi:hypothetical protein